MHTQFVCVCMCVCVCVCVCVCEGCILGCETLLLLPSSSGMNECVLLTYLAVLSNKEVDPGIISTASQERLTREVREMEQLHSQHKSSTKCQLLKDFKVT